MVARGAGAARPVLLACRQWDPLGLARRLPSLGVGAWRCAPLLPWRVQCPVCVCAALAAGSGGFGPVPGVVSPLLPPSRPACSALRVAGRPVRVSLTLARWYAIPCGLCVPRARSGCPSGSPRVSFSCVCARALAVFAPRWVVWRAHLAWSRHWALVGPFHVVCAPPRVLPRSRAPSGVLGGGAVRSRFPPTWLGVVGAAAGRPRGGAFGRCVGRLGSCAPPPPTARPLGGLSGSALWARACGCGGPALFPWGGREVSTWCPGAGPPDSHDEPDARGALPCGLRGGVGVTVAGVVHQCSGSWPSRAPLLQAYTLHRGRGLRALLFCDPGASVSQKAAALEVAHPARAAKELVRTP